MQSGPCRVSMAGWEDGNGESGFCLTTAIAWVNNHPTQLDVASQPTHSLTHRMNSTDLYELIGYFATAAQIRDFLRRYKEDHKKEIHVSGPKEDLLTDLRRGVEKGIIPPGQAFD